MLAPAGAASRYTNPLLNVARHLVECGPNLRLGPVVPVHLFSHAAIRIKNDEPVVFKTVLGDLSLALRRRGILNLTLKCVTVLLVQTIHDGRYLRAKRSARDGVVHNPRGVYCNLSVVLIATLLRAPRASGAK